MDRDRRSPSYSPPPQFLQQSRRRSPSYSPPRSHRGGGGGRSYRDPPRDHRSPPRENYPPRDQRSPPRENYREPPRRFYKRSKSRSPSPRRRKRDRSPDKEASPKRGRMTGSTQGPKLETFDFERDDAEARLTFCCKHCDVSLHDLVSIESHLRGKPHLMQQQRLKDNQLRIATGFGIKARHPPDLDQVQYDDSFWQREKGPRKLKPEQERWLDETRLDKIEAKFQGDSYDQGQFHFRPESFHCDVCDVWVRSRDQMQAHKEGKNHKKKSDKVVRHHCSICLIDVTCRDTLENHMRGKDHIKRAQQLAEQKRRMGQRSSLDEDDQEAVQESKSSEEYRKENEDLKRQLKILQNKVKELQEYKKFCKDTHENKDFKELLELKRYCIENHQRPIELQKPGIHCKQEREPSPHEPSSRRSVKSEKRRSYHESDEDRKKGIKKEVKKEVKKEGASWHTPNVSNEASGARKEYVENEDTKDTKPKVGNEHASPKKEYVENESKLKSETNADDDIILVE